MKTAVHPETSERGIALVFALLVLLLLTLVGLSFSAHSFVDYQISENYVTHQEALAIADSGLAAIRPIIQDSDFNTLLEQTTNVPAYDASDIPTAGTQDSRNPISMRAARNVDFSSPPSAVGTYEAKGILTPVGGQAFGDGRYFAKLSNNSFGAATSLFGADPDAEVDTDYRVLVRVTGVRPVTASDKITGTSSARNSVATIEAMFKRNMAFNVGSPLAVNGPSVTATFNGNKLSVDGYNHNGMTRAQIEAEHTENTNGAVPGLAAIYDNPSGGDAAGTASALYDMLNDNQADNVTGAIGIHVDDTPSVSDITNSLRTSSNPDNAKVLDPDFVGNFVEAVKTYANDYYATSQTLSGNGIVMGTLDDPKITYFNGDLSINGTGSGAGILIVRGTFEVGGAFEYDGVILVVGTGEINLHGSEEGVIGGMYVQKLTRDANGSWIPGNSVLRLNGNSDFYFSSDMVQMGLQLLPLQLLEWREITPEISN